MKSLALAVVITTLAAPVLLQATRDAAAPPLGATPPDLAAPAHSVHAAHAAQPTPAPQPARRPRAESDVPPPPPPPPSPPAPPAPAPPRGREAPPPPPPPPPPAPEQWRPLPTRNVKVEVTITEQNGTSEPVKKVATVVVADGRQSSVRSVSGVPVAFDTNRELPLQVEATVILTPDHRVLLELRFAYSSVTSLRPLGGDNRPTPTTDAERERERVATAPRVMTAQVTENLSALLTPGVPLVMSRAADAATDRTVTVEVKADILK